MKIGQYLIEKLRAHNARHVFGVPGDYALSFFDLLNKSSLRVVNTCDEQGAGFAADAYARLNGLGVVCVTYCVGGLKITNTTAQAYAEKSPVVIISGAPGTNERIKNPLLHHKVRDFDTQLRVFKELTVAAAVLDDPETAFREVDRVLAACLRHKRPVYIEIPRDMVNKDGIGSWNAPVAAPTSEPDSLKEALGEALEMLRHAKKPVIIAGIEIHRFGLQDKFLEFLEKTNIPAAATILSKSVIGEYHPRYMGIYEGAMSHEDIIEYVESSDCLVFLGVFMTDVDLGIYTAHLDPNRSIHVTSEKVSIRHHHYEDVLFEDFLDGLIAGGIPRNGDDDIPRISPPSVFKPAKSAKITIRRLFQCLNSFLTENTIVITDPGDALFGGAELFIHRGAEFLGPAYYTSMGFAVPAALGAQLASPQLRPLVIVGDGAFQMTGMELSTIVRFGLNPIIVVLNNGGYGTERPMMDGPFNDILSWRYARIPEFFGKGGKGFEVRTEEDLNASLRTGWDHKEGFSILDVQLDPSDASPALKRLTAALAKKVK